MSSPSEQQFVERARQLYKKDRQAAMAGIKLGENEPEATRVLASDIPYEFEEPHNYIMDVNERQRLFAKIRPLIAHTVDVNSTVLAVFMVYPLSELRSLVESLAEYDSSSAEDLKRYIYSSTQPFLLFCLKSAHEAIAGFLARSTKSTASKSPSRAATPESTTRKRKRQNDAAQPETPSPLQKRVLLANAEGQPAIEADESSFARETSPGTPSSPLGKMASTPPSPITRSRNAVKRAKDRDSHKCILTGTDNPESAHIYPFSAGPASGRTKYINMLVNFWGKEKSDAWLRQCCTTSVTESAKNLLCLNSQLHFWWGTCRLALRPIRTLDPCTIKLQLHWLRRARTRPTTPLSGTSDDIRLLCGGEDDLETWGPQPVAHRMSGLPLRTGQIFTIRAENPEDLPSFELLDMQWNLLRVAAMSGAAEAEDAPPEEGDDDNEYSGHYVPSDVSDDDVEEFDLYRTEEDEMQST
ncbi:hypothetical protein SEPCBS57363_006760 [Sporothrix epigloea]|uniref:HNH nuclease domain-containing protein n=1 Tax=Sporothrix epigloea TaxID=1892477 RepID=A0ABP0E7C5_9PEZI